MRKTIIFFISISIFILSSCTSNNEEHRIPINKNKDAVLIYMASDNNLYTYAVRNIKVIEEVYNEASEKQILIYIDAPDGKAKLVRVVNTPKGKESLSEVIKEYESPNSSNPQILDKVIGDATAYIGTNRITDIVLWSHGRSWLPYQYTTINSIRDDKEVEMPQGNGIAQYSFGVDNSAAKDEMNIDKMAVVLSKYKFDNIIFDACYMSSIEVLYQLRNVASCIVASPAEVLAEGFAYHVMTPLLTRGKVDGKDVAKTFFDYYNTKSGAARSATIAAVDCSKLEALAGGVKVVIDKYATSIDNEKIRVNVGQYDRDESNQYLYDLRTYIVQIIKSCAKTSDVDGEIASFDALYNDVILFEGHTPFMLESLSFENTFGISGYIPSKDITKQNSNSYFKILEWSEASGLSNPIFF
ncbi:MAG: clostripain-related cysteine peptidase [Rikenellaceae bacterium]